MRAWTEMTAADFNTGGTQLDMFAGIEGDGCGTLDLFDAVAEVEVAARVEPVPGPWAVETVLFGDEQLMIGVA